MQRLRTSFLAGSSIQRSASLFGILVTALLVTTDVASAADTQLCTVTNNSGQIASDLHVTLTGTGGVITKVLPIAVDGCGPPTVNIVGGNRVDLDWGTPCVPIGGEVNFSVTTPNGPLGLVDPETWTSPPVPIPAADITLAKAMDVTCQGDDIGTLVIRKYQVDSAHVTDATRGGIIMEATFLLAATPGNKCWCEDVRFINFLVQYSQAANFLPPVCPALPYVDPHIANMYPNCPIALQDDVLPWFWTNTELPGFVTGDQPFDDWTATPGAFTFKFHDKPNTGLLPNMVGFETALVCVHSPTEIAILKTWQWGFDVAATGVTTLNPAAVIFPASPFNPAGGFNNAMRATALKNSGFPVDPPTAGGYKFITQEETLHHFKEIHLFTLNQPGDTGPADTSRIGPGLFDFSPLPAGTQQGGMTSDAVPDGLLINKDTGAVSGTPTVAGVFHVLCNVLDEGTGQVVALLWWEIIVDDGILPHLSIQFVGSTLTNPVAVAGVDTSGFTGPGPFSFEAVSAGQTFRGTVTGDLPSSLVINPDTGAVTGSVFWPGQYHVLCVVTSGGTWDVVGYVWWDFIIDGPHIPAVSDWGVVAMTLLVLTAATVVLLRRRAGRKGGDLTA